jgi:radical SAM superfamily enzyme YgiQ (UPF0313 family)
MKIILVNLPTGITSDSLIVPLGILSLASFLEKNNHQPIIIDFNLLIKLKKIDINSNFFKKAARLILSYRTPIIGFSCFNNNLPATLLIARECKKINPDIIIILGGPEVSFESKKLLSVFPQIDMIIKGEGEITLLELLNALGNGNIFKDIPGLVFRENNSIVENPDRSLIKNLDSLPLTNYKLLPKHYKYPAGAIEGGRGCPFRCAFCSTSNMWGRCFRLKSPKRLSRELLRASKCFHGSLNYPVAIHHDNLLVDRNSANIFLSILSEHDIAWFCSSRLSTLDEQMIASLKIAGCRNVFIGIETASPKIQKRINKFLNLSRIPNILKTFYKRGLGAVLAYIIGFPFENKRDVNCTLLNALQCKLYNPDAIVRIYSLIPLKGSALYQRYKRKINFRFRRFHCLTPLITKLPEEIRLINKYPRIFPSFFYFQTKAIPPATLEKICSLFNFLTNFFPISTLSILSLLSLTPLQLSATLISFFEKKGIKNWSLSYLLEDQYSIYETVFKKYVESLGSARLNLILKYEYLNRRKGSVAQSQKNISAYLPKGIKQFMQC